MWLKGWMFVKLLSKKDKIPIDWLDIFVTFFWCIMFIGEYTKEKPKMRFLKLLSLSIFFFLTANLLAQAFPKGYYEDFLSLSGVWCDLSWSRLQSKRYGAIMYTRYEYIFTFTAMLTVTWQKKTVVMHNFWNSCGLSHFLVKYASCFCFLFFCVLARQELNMIGYSCIKYQRSHLQLSTNMHLMGEQHMQLPCCLRWASTSGGMLAYSHKILACLDMASGPQETLLPSLICHIRHWETGLWTDSSGLYFLQCYPLQPNASIQWNHVLIYKRNGKLSLYFNQQRLLWGWVAMKIFPF